MLRATAVTAASALVLLAAGCGSSGSSTASSASGSATATTGSSLKVATTPKYAAPSGSQPVLSGTAAVSYRNITISPDTLRVKVGTTIRWTNYDPVEHNVTSRGGPQRFASPPLGEGATFSIVAAHPGLIHYLCTIHPTSMNGTIEVVR